MLNLVACDVDPKLEVPKLEVSQQSASPCNFQQDEQLSAG